MAPGRGDEPMDDSAGQREQHATSRGIVIGPGQGRTIPGTDAITLIATTEQTGGSIGVFEDTSSPGDGPPRHVHYGSDELFYLLEGELLILVGAATRKRVGRDLRLRPKGDGTRLQGHRDRAGKGVLSAFVPGGPERAFEEFVKLRTEGEEVNRSSRRSRTVAEMNKLFAKINEKYDSEFVGPPL